MMRLQLVKDSGQAGKSRRTVTPHSLPDTYNLYQTTGTNIFVANVIVGKSDMRAFYFQQVDFCLIGYFFSKWPGSSIEYSRYV